MRATEGFSRLTSVYEAEFHQYWADNKSIFWVILSLYYSWQQLLSISVFQRERIIEQVLATANGSATLVLLFTFDLLKGPRYKLIPFAQYVLSFHLSPPHSSLINKKKVFVHFQVFHVETLPLPWESFLPRFWISCTKCLLAVYPNMGLKLVPTRIHMLHKYLINL